MASNFFFPFRFRKFLSVIHCRRSSNIFFASFVQRKRLDIAPEMGTIFCCITVDQSTVAMKERFGKFDEVLDPGCHCMPWILGSQLAGHLSLRLQQLDVRCETKTKVRFCTGRSCLADLLHLRDSL